MPFSGFNRLSRRLTAPTGAERASPPSVTYLNAGREEEWDVVIPAIARVSNAILHTQTVSETVHPADKVLACQHLNPFRQADIYMCTKPNQGVCTLPYRLPATRLF